MKSGYGNYHFFWSGPFSQWDREFSFTHPAYPGITFNCAEQYMMYNKATIFSDFETAQKILDTKNPRDQKALGREVRNFDKNTWDRVARDVVYTGNKMKFKQNDKYRTALLATGDAIIVEASPEDLIWGIGYHESNALENIQNWGTNWLGEVLMKVRDDIQKGRY